MRLVAATGDMGSTSHGVDKLPGLSISGDGDSATTELRRDNSQVWQQRVKKVVKAKPNPG